MLEKCPCFWPYLGTRFAWERLFPLQSFGNKKVAKMQRSDPLESKNLSWPPQSYAQHKFCQQGALLDVPVVKAASRSIIIILRRLSRPAGQHTQGLLLHKHTTEFWKNKLKTNRNKTKQKPNTPPQKKPTTTRRSSVKALNNNGSFFLFAFQISVIQLIIDLGMDKKYNFLWSGRSMSWVWKPWRAIWNRECWL